MPNVSMILALSSAFIALFFSTLEIRSCRGAEQRHRIRGFNFVFAVYTTVRGLFQNNTSQRMEDSVRCNKNWIFFICSSLTTLTKITRSLTKASNIVGSSCCLMYLSDFSSTALTVTFHLFTMRLQNVNCRCDILYVYKDEDLYSRSSYLLCLNVFLQYFVLLLPYILL